MPFLIFFFDAGCRYFADAFHFAAAFASRALSRFAISLHSSFTFERFAFAPLLSSPRLLMHARY